MYKMDISFKQFLLGRDFRYFAANWFNCFTLRLSRCYRFTSQATELAKVACLVTPKVGRNVLIGCPAYSASATFLSLVNK